MQHAAFADLVVEANFLGRIDAAIAHAKEPLEQEKRIENGLTIKDEASFHLARFFTGELILECIEIAPILAEFDYDESRKFHKPEKRLFASRRQHHGT